MHKKSKIISMFLATICLVGFSGCSDVKTKIEQLKCDHVMDGVEITLEPTCEVAGEKIETCSLCGYEETLSIPATGHAWHNVVSETPTCVDVGAAGVQCATCEEWMVTSFVVPATGHTKVVVPGYAATCFETGLTDGEKCAVCDEVFIPQEEICKKEHVAEEIPGYDGVEFSDYAGMEKSIFKGQRTKLYYCHPYSSYERGTNERLNREIRRKIPKGSDLRDYSQNDIQSLEDWLNDYPRQILSFATPNELFNENLIKI